MNYDVYQVGDDLMKISGYSDVYVLVRDGVYIFYKSSSSFPTAIFPIKHYYVVEVTE